MKNYYKILEVDRYSTAEDIKLSFRNLAKKYHPDSNSGSSNFTEIMQDINEAYGVLSKSDIKRKYDIEWDKIFGKPKEEQKQKSSQNSQRSSSNRQNSSSSQSSNKSKTRRNSNEYFWDGSKSETSESNESFEKFKRRILQKEKKGEFEKTSDFQKRVEALESELLNNYLGKQNIKMNYEADSEKFFIAINKTLHFQIDVSIDIAESFKANVKNFYIRFSKDLEILEISTEFRGHKFVGKGFNRNWKVKRFDDWETKRFELGN
jgi:curved DNA-binding protein